MNYFLFFLSCLSFFLSACGKSKVNSSPSVILDDPLFSQQWYIEKMNMKQTIKDGISGRGIKIAIIDTGLQVDHEDLESSIDRGKSCRFSENDSSSNNEFYCADNNPVTNDAHGTQVAGIIAMTANNGLGGRGIAPDSEIRSYVIASLTSEHSKAFNNIYQKKIAFGDPDYGSKNVDIFNQSFGIVSNTYKLISPEIDKIQKRGFKKSRDGKGAIYVKSAGNGFMGYKYRTATSTKDAKCEEANFYKISCQNSNMDPHNSQVYNIVVAALNKNNKKASYSATGSNIWVSGYGGEKGISNGIFTTKIIGYNKDFVGTSAAAPTISGAIALILEANPNLTAREVKYILAKTATVVDRNVTSLLINEYVARDEWITNGAGFNFHNWYGFGAINVDKAVTEARSYISTWGAVENTSYTKSSINMDIPDNSINGLDNTIIIDDKNIIIEEVQVIVDIEHPDVGELAIELISPNALTPTRSVLFTPFSGFSGSENLKNMTLLSNAFYGEEITGTWQLKIIDLKTQNTGKLKMWKLVIYGHQKN